MKKVVRLTESDLERIVKRVINEQQSTFVDKCIANLEKWGKENPSQKLPKIPEACYKNHKKDSVAHLTCMKAIKGFQARYAEPIGEFMECRKKPFIGVS